jgi:hypothetical protein
VLPGVSPGVNPQIKQGVQFTVVSGDNDKQSGLAEISINLEYRLSAYTASLEHGATSVVYNGVADNNDYFDVVISSNDDGSQPSGLVEKTGTVTYKTLSINLSVGSNHTFFAFISGDAFNLPFNQQNASFQGWVKIKEIRINFITAAIPAILQLLLIE